MLQINLTVLATAHAVSEASCAASIRDAARNIPTLHIDRSARGAGTAAHDAAGGQPFAVKTAARGLEWRQF